jgi:hypothetical protein
MAPAPSPHDPLVLRRVVVGVIAALLAIVVGVQITNGVFAVAATLAGAAYLFTAGVNYRWLAVVLLVLRPAAVIVPFMPGRPFLWEVCVMLAWPSLIFALMINRLSLPHWRVDRRETWALGLLAGYAVVIVVLMLARGVGFRALGGEQMGGRFYMQQVILLVVPLLLIVADPKRSTLIVALVIGWCLSTTYLISDFALAWGGPRFYPVLRFFELPTDAINFFVGFELTGVRRYQSLWFVGTAIIACTCVACSLRDCFGRRAFIAIPILLGAFLLALGSGHRTVLVQTVFLFAFLSVFQRFWTPLRALAAGCTAMMFVAAIYLAAPSLPVSVQRSISFLPGIEVTGQAKDDATATLRDRLEVLEMGIRDVPKYWLVGRGFGMQRFDLAPAAGGGIEEQYANGLFYNGFVGSILKMGLPGLFCTLGFVLVTSKAALHLVDLVRDCPPHDWTAFHRLSLYVSAQWFSLTAFFYFFHGDAGDWAQTFMLPAALVFMCRRKLQEPKLGETLSPA